MARSHRICGTSQEPSKEEQRGENGCLACCGEAVSLGSPLCCSVRDGLAPGSQGQWSHGWCPRQWVEPKHTCKMYVSTVPMEQGRPCLRPRSMGPTCLPGICARLGGLNLEFNIHYLFKNPLWSLTFGGPSVVCGIRHSECPWAMRQDWGDR